MNTRPLRRLIATCGLALLVTAPAIAQEPEPDPLEAEAALLGETGLLEKAPTDEPVTADPDEKMLERVSAARTRVEQKINTIQQAVSKFPDLDEGLGQLNMGMLKGIEGYVEQHRTALQQYRDAFGKGDSAAQARHAKEIDKLRKGFIAQLDKLDKSADKLVEQASKLEAKLAAWEAEEAAEAAKAAEAGGAAVPAGGEAKGE
jgi:uncharacterized phage infection (PIP) family protein YhgE